MLKAKYYPQFHVLKAKIHSRPSYTWSNILSSQDLVEHGAFWRVGDGSNVEIFNDK